MTRPGSCSAHGLVVGNKHARGSLASVPACAGNSLCEVDVASMDVCLGMGPFRLSRHARERAVERRIPLEVVWIVIFHGMPVRDERGDRYSVQGIPRPRSIPPELWRKAVGVVVPVDRYGGIPTLIRELGPKTGAGRG
jgi:hypothetical protein